MHRARDLDGGRVVRDRRRGTIGAARDPGALFGNGTRLDEGLRGLGNFARLQHAQRTLIHRQRAIHRDARDERILRGALARAASENIGVELLFLRPHLPPNRRSLAL